MKNLSDYLPGYIECAKDKLAAAEAIVARAHRDGEQPSMSELALYFSTKLDVIIDHVMKLKDGDTQGICPWCKIFVLDAAHEPFCPVFNSDKEIK